MAKVTISEERYETQLDKQFSIGRLEGILIASLHVLDLSGAHFKAGNDMEAKQYRAMHAELRKVYEAKKAEHEQKFK
jgi:hypothetical protein